MWVSPRCWGAVPTLRSSSQKSIIKWRRRRREEEEQNLRVQICVSRKEKALRAISFQLRFQHYFVVHGWISVQKSFEIDKLCTDRFRKHFWYHPAAPNLSNPRIHKNDFGQDFGDNNLQNHYIDGFDRLDSFQSCCDRSKVSKGTRMDPLDCLKWSRTFHKGGTSEFMIILRLSNHNVERSTVPLKIAPFERDFSPKNKVFLLSLSCFPLF